LKLAKKFLTIKMIFKNKIKYVAAGVVLIGVVLLIYAFGIEPNLISVTHTKIKISSDADNLTGNLTCKLLVISDIHAASEDHEKFLTKVVKEINKIDEKEKIDAVIIAGDSIDYYTDEIKFLTPLKDIKNKNKYAILGNHDYGHNWCNKETADEVEKYMESIGIDVMRNEHRIICNGTIRIDGIDDIWSPQYDIDKTFSGNKTTEKIPEILIAHNPDAVYLLGKYKPGLIISGHTHGGQVNIPFIGPVFMPSKVGKICPSGLCIINNYNINNYKIYITRGVGGNPRIRFLSSPEISIIELN